MFLVPITHTLHGPVLWLLRYTVALSLYTCTAKPGASRGSQVIKKLTINTHKTVHFAGNQSYEYEPNV